MDNTIPDETYTDFMVRSMSGEDEVQSAFLIIRRTNGTIGYRCFNQEIADTIGVLRFAQLSVENDLIADWKDE